MSSAHTQAAIEWPPLGYETGEKIHIPVTGKRSYSHRIKVHKRRSIKPQLVKDELKARDAKERHLMRTIQRLIRPKPGLLEKLVNKMRRK